MATPRGNKAQSAPKMTAAQRLEAKAKALKAKEDNQRTEIAQANYVQIVSSPEATVLNKQHADFIRGAKYKGFVIPKEKISLGTNFDAVVLGVINLYEETIPNEDPTGMPVIIGYWHKDDALNFPIIEGSYFNRAFEGKDGKTHTLSPVHWIFLYLPGQPELTDVRITTRGAGNKYGSELSKLISSNASMCTELLMDVSVLSTYNEKFKKTFFYPQFAVKDRVFTLTADGKVKLGTVLDEETVEKVIDMADELQTIYDNGKLVRPKTNLLQLVSPRYAKQLALPETTQDKTTPLEEGEEHEIF